LYKKLTVIFAVILLALIADRVIFTATDAKVELKPEVLRASENSQLQITVFRSNMLGFKVPFSSVDVRYTVEEGNNLIEIVNEEPDGNATIRSKGIEGEAIIGIYSIKSGLPVKKILIKILPRNVA
jgi:hypothetical protein